MLRDAGPDVLGLAGRGVLDTTRIAAGDQVLWTEILRGNAANVARELVDVASSLSWVAIALAEYADLGDRGALERVTELLAHGRRGRACRQRHALAARRAV
ncbi:hypothetical protein K7G98_20910, partial [Saccharothrix sp. MB29]|nr:hypothetical protein [Saccharothrix sp. MB29]